MSVYCWATVSDQHILFADQHILFAYCTFSSCSYMYVGVKCTGKLTAFKIRYRLGKRRWIHTFDRPFDQVLGRSAHMLGSYPSSQGFLQLIFAQSQPTRWNDPERPWHHLRAARRLNQIAHEWLVNFPARRLDGSAFTMSSLRWIELGELDFYRTANTRTNVV